MTRIITFFLIALISLCVANENNPPKCRNYQQACAAELIKFPELVAEQQTVDSTTTEHGITTSTNTNDEVHLEGSGEADVDHIQFVPIGMGMSFPMYDEFVPTTPVYDYSAEPVGKAQQQICSCPEEEACDFDSADRVVSFNHQIRAAFCKPVEDVFKLKCKGARTLARVIGTLESETEDRLTAINDTVVFCRCESGEWSRMMVEPWINNAFAFSYKCLSR